MSVLYFDSEVTILCATWNVAALDPSLASETVRRWLCVYPGADLVCVGLCEMIELSPVKVVRDALLRSKKRVGEWRRVIGDILPDYEELGREWLCGLALFVFGRVDSDPLGGRRIAVGSVGLGVGGLGNKGAVAARLDFGSKKLCVVHSHLAADQDQLQARNNMYKALVEAKWTFTANEHVLAKKKQGQFCFCDQSFFCFSEEEDNALLSADLVVWMGDLNYRLDDIAVSYNPLVTPTSKRCARPAVDHRIREAMSSRDFQSLIDDCDQLRRVIRRRNAFEDFDEAEITFPPTYKIDHSGDYVKKRRPAYCDRVLWKEKKERVRKDSFLPRFRLTREEPEGDDDDDEESSGSSSRLRVLKYFSVEEPVGRKSLSDHMPVGCVFKWKS